MTSQVVIERGTAQATSQCLTDAQCTAWFAELKLGSALSLPKADAQRFNSWLFWMSEWGHEYGFEVDVDRLRCQRVGVGKSKHFDFWLA